MGCKGEPELPRLRMIIDLHTQIWASLDQLGHDAALRIRSRQADRWARLDASTDSHERAMECVNGAVVIGFRSAALGAAIPDEFIAEFVKRDPARRVGVAGIDPLDRDALDRIATATKLGLIGIAISPACHGFHPAHSSAMRVYERCDELKLPVFVTMQEPLTPRAVLELARPAAWDEVARAFPTLAIIISGAGYPWIDETLTLIAKHDRVFTDIAGIAARPWQLYNMLLAASSLDVMDKLLFASGFPFETPARTIETLYTINAFSQGTNLPAVPRSLIRDIIERDSLELLGIDSAIRPTASIPDNSGEDDDDEDDMVASAAELRRQRAEDPFDSWEDDQSS